MNILQEFKETSFFKEILDNHKVIMCYLAGSRSFGLEDSQSDYDIVFYCDQPESAISPYQFLVYDNKYRLHWYFESLRDRYSLREEVFRGGHLIGGSLMKKLEEESILYVNEDYRELIDWLSDNHDYLTRVAGYLLYNKSKKIIEKILSEGYLDERTWSKNLYRLCALKNKLKNEPYDKEFLIKIKRTPEGYKDDILNKGVVVYLKELREYIKNNPRNIDKETEEINARISSLLEIKPEPPHKKSIKI